MITLRTVLPDGSRGENYTSPIYTSHNWGKIISLGDVKYRVDYVKWKEFDDAQGVLHLMDEDSYKDVVVRLERKRFKNRLFWFVIGALVTISLFVILDKI